MTHPDALCEIFARVPFVDQAALACVSPTWASLVASHVPTTRAESEYCEAVLIEFHAEDYESDSDESDSDSDEDSDEEDDDGKMTSTVTMVSQSSGLAKALPPLPDARVDFGTCNLEGRLYVIGGRNAMFKVRVRGGASWVVGGGGKRRTARAPSPPRPNSNCPSTSSSSASC